ncbi:sugar transferase [bacterium]|nr:sugar transferase [bacterium]
MHNKSLLTRGIIRTFDIVASLTGLIILSPFILAIAAAIKLQDGGKILFIQERAGLNGTTFRIYKFRSMIEGSSKIGLFIHGQNDNRITPIGKYLRLSSIDEIPQLINVLKGEMSIVGPRPAFPDHINKYSACQMTRLNVRPGITGWAQVNGRNSLSWSEKIEYDIWYVEKRSFLMNMKIMFLTLPVLFKKNGLYASEKNFSFNPNISEPKPATNHQEAPPATTVHHQVVNQ